MVLLEPHVVFGALFDSLHDRDFGRERVGSTDDVRNLVGPNTEAIVLADLTHLRADLEADLHERCVDPDSGSLAHDFTDPAWDTPFVGDLCQDVAESARRRYALLQTPEFVEEFIPDRTLTPAIEEFGFREVRLIEF